MKGELIHKIKRAIRILFCRHFSGIGFNRNVHSEIYERVYICEKCGELINYYCNECGKIIVKNYLAGLCYDCAKALKNGSDDKLSKK